MFPGFATNNASYGLNSNAILFCQVANPLSFRVTLADGKNNIFGEFTWFTATLARLVLMIFGLCSQKQMGRIHTGGIVAFVANMQIIRNRAVVNLITYTMRAYRFAVYPHLAVSGWKPDRLPFPTFVGSTNGNLFPETGLNSSPASVSVLMTADESSRRHNFLSTATCAKAWLNSGVRLSAFVSFDISHRLGFDRIVPPRSLFGKMGLLSTTAHTKPGRVGAFEESVWRTLAMTLKKAHWFAFNLASLGACLLCNGSLLPTSTLAIAVGDFLRGWIRGMINHCQSLLLDFGRAGSVHSTARRSYWLYSCDYSIETPILQGYSSL